MNELDRLHSALRSTQPGISAHRLRACMKGLEASLEMRPQRRTQLTLQRLSLRGEKSGEFRFHPGVNILRAGNDKGKSSILKLVQFCLTGKNELKKDVDGWISQVELDFELDGVPHAIEIDKSRRPRGRLVRLDDGGSRAVELLAFKNGKQMQGGLETFFNATFGLRPLMGTQKASRKDSDALLDSPTSYRAYFRGMYVNQDLSYTSLITDGVPYGNLFMKVVGMLLGVRGIEASFAVEARRAHLENKLAKEERYHRRLKESMGLRDLATLEEEIDKLERYIDERKVERTALFVRATSRDLDQRLTAMTRKLVALDAASQRTASRLHAAELDQQTSEQEIAELESALASHRALAPIQPDRCPVCETQIAQRKRHRRPVAGRCVLCHEDVPEADSETFTAVAEQRLERARESLAEQRRAVSSRRAELQELEVRSGEHGQQKNHLQAQLRGAHQGTAELDREIELETRYLGRLEAERESAARMVSQDGGGDIAELLRQKKTLDAVLRHLRTRHADANERMKQDFARRVQDYCTTIGFPGLEDIRVDAQLKPQIRQNGRVYTFEELSPGEKVRFVLAFYLGMAVATAEDPEHGTHPGLLLIDSPGREEMVERDFEAVVKLLRRVDKRHASVIQVIVATSVKAIRDATRAQKQVFIDNDDDPLFS